MKKIALLSSLIYCSTTLLHDGGVSARNYYRYTNSVENPLKIIAVCTDDVGYIKELADFSSSYLEGKYTVVDGTMPQTGDVTAAYIGRVDDTASNNCVGKYSGLAKFLQDHKNDPRTAALPGTKIKTNVDNAVYYDTTAGAVRNIIAICYSSKKACDSQLVPMFFGETSVD